MISQDKEYRQKIKGHGNTKGAFKRVKESKKKKDKSILTTFQK
jgi:hypothetical protein